MRKSNRADPEPHRTEVHDCDAHTPCPVSMAADTGQGLSATPAATARSGHTALIAAALA